ncbi:MAG TPA: hypothetical protein VD929_11005 [Caulobacteraceae bacterium]|nr:hypothetical protein [Caulobacteraceae bacterium]
MAGLSAVQLGAVRTLVQGAPDEALRSLSRALAGAAGGPMAEIRDMVSGEQGGRALRAAVLSPVLPLFTPRPDGVRGLSFPRRALSGLWSLLAQEAPDLIAEAERACRDWDPDAAPPEVFDRACLRAAEALRARPETVFRSGEADAASAAELAACLELAPVVRAAAARLGEWLGRATDERIAALKLAFKDAVALQPDGAPRLMEMLLAHLSEASLSLRLIAMLMDRPAERYVASSELASFGERLLDDAEARIARIKAFQPHLGPGPAHDAACDVAAVCAAFAEFEQNVLLSKEGPWGSRVAAGRRALAQTVEMRLREVEDAVAQALPLQTVRLHGRMTRQAPKLEFDLDERVVTKARALSTFLEETRASAAVGGYGALRNQVAERVADRLDKYAEEVLALINGGEAGDEERARAHLELAAEFLGHAADPKAAQIVRRRAAVAGVAQTSQDVA